MKNEAEGKKEFKAITLKFGKGYLGKEFAGKDGNQYREILVPPDKASERPWATFVVKADSVHENQYGKGMWMKLPAEGNTTIRWSVDISPEGSTTKEYLSQQEKIPNMDLKKMMEAYKERPKESVMDKLEKKKEETRLQNTNIEKQEKIKSKEAEL